MNNRVAKFQQVLEKHAEIAFFPISADLQYLTGIKREMPTFGAVRHPGAWVEGLWVAPGHAPILVLTRMTADFNNPGSLDRVYVLGDWEDPVLLISKVVSDLGLSEVTTFALGEKTSGETFINLQASFPGVKFVSASQLLASQRMVKTEDEIAMMRAAGKITEEAFSSTLKALKPGMKEIEVVLEVDYQLRTHGAFGPSFNTTLYAVGPDHELVFNKPEITWQRVLHPPVSLMFDFGAILDGYCYDFGRTVYFGTPDEEMLRVHRLVMASQRAGITAMKAGYVTAEEVDQAARKVIADAGMGEAFRHRLGHSIGLDVHEAPFLTKGDQTRLEAGMLFTVEPSVIVPYGPSARVEDVVLVGKDGGIPLTEGYQNLIIID